MNIAILDTKPTFDHYQNTGAPTQTELWYDPRSNEVQVRQECKTNSTLLDVYHGNILTCHLDGHPREEDVRQVIEDSEDLLERVRNGYESHWDGSNLVGKYTADAKKAWEEFCDLLETCLPYYEFWDTEEYIGDAMRDLVNADTPDEELRRYAKEWTEVEPGTVLDADAEWVYTRLVQYRDELREEQLQEG